MARKTVADRRRAEMVRNREIHERGHFTAGERFDNSPRFEWEPAIQCDCGAVVIGSQGLCNACAEEKDD
jgi:hypothetical protein